MSSDSPVVMTVSARALASRRNGAKSRGPRTAAGKVRASRNALKHGLCATKLVVFAEDAAEFRAFEKALLAELAPEGALQGVLAQRVVSAAWHLRRADQLEAEVLDFRRYDNADLGVALMRDGNGPRSIETVMRYRGAATAELMRALKTLQGLQAEAAAGADRPASKRIELERMRQRNPAPPKSTTATPANQPRHDTSDRDGPTAGAATSPATAPDTTAAPDGTTAQRGDLPVPRRARHEALHRDRPGSGPAALPSAVTTTKRIPETTANQNFRS